MSASTIALLAISVLPASALWFSLRMTAAVDLTMLPSQSRRQICWWRSHANYVYVVALMVVALQIVS